MPLSADRIVRVNERPTPQLSTVKAFDKLLFVTDTATTASVDNIDQMIVESTVRSYASLSDAENDWSGGTSPRAAAGIWFQQSPFPGRFAVIPHVAAGREGILVGATATGTRSEIQALTSFEFGGQAVTVDLSAATTPSDVATAVATGINGINDLTGVTVAAGGSDALPANGASSINLVVTIPQTATAVANLDVAQGFAGADANALGMVAGARYAPPIPVSAAVRDTLARAKVIDNTFYFVALSNALSTDANINDVSAWVDGEEDYMFCFDDNDANLLTAGESVSTPAALKALARDRTFCFYSRTRDYKSVSMAAFFSSTDYTAANAVKTGANRTLPGTAADNELTDTQADELDRKSVNYYAPAPSANRTFFGYTLGQTADGRHGWIDERIWKDWLKYTLETRTQDLFATVNRVPLSEAGSLLVESFVRRICEQGRRNGGFVPGELTQAVTGAVQRVTGNAGFDGEVPDGYTTYVEPITEDNLDNRTVPTFHVWGVYGGGGNRAIINLTI